MTHHPPLTIAETAARLSVEPIVLVATMPELAQEALAWLAEQENGVAYGAPHCYAATLRHSRSLRQCVTVTRRKHPRADQQQCVYSLTDEGRAVVARLPSPAAYPNGWGVYFIQGQTTRLIKIGYASSVGARLTLLQCGSPDLLALIGHEPAPREREAVLHRQFADARAHGEWFRPTHALLDYIRRLQRAVA